MTNDEREKYRAEIRAIQQRKAVDRKRRLQHLRAIGYSHAAIAERTNMTRQQVSAILRNSKPLRVNLLREA